MLRNKYFIAFLGVLLMGVITYNVIYFRSKNTPSPSDSSGQPASKKEKAFNTDRSFYTSYRPTWRRDPFWYTEGAVRSPYVTVRSRGLNLEGTMVKDGKGYAIISGEVVEVGDRIQGVVIVEIGDQTIKVKGNQGTKTIHIATDQLEKENN